MLYQSRCNAFQRFKNFRMCVILIQGISYLQVNSSSVISAIFRSGLYISFIVWRYELKPRIYRSRSSEILSKSRMFRNYIDLLFSTRGDARSYLITFLMPIHIESGNNEFQVFIVLAHCLVLSKSVISRTEYLLFIALKHEQQRYIIRTKTTVYLNSTSGVYWG